MDVTKNQQPLFVAVPSVHGTDGQTGQQQNRRKQRLSGRNAKNCWTERRIEKSTNMKEHGR